MVFSVKWCGETWSSRGLGRFRVDIKNDDNGRMDMSDDMMPAHDKSRHVCAARMVGEKGSGQNETKMQHRGARTVKVRRVGNEDGDVAQVAGGQ